jgi:hypothetical protein
MLNVRDEFDVFVVSVASLDECEGRLPVRTDERLIALAEVVLERRPR